VIPLLYRLRRPVAALRMAANPNASPRTLLLHHSLAALFRARKHALPTVPASLHSLIDSAREGVRGMLGRPGCREALIDLRARVFQIPGREAQGLLLWEESVAAAVFAARIAQLRAAPAVSAFGGGLLHRAGEALALRMLARVELDFRMQLDAAARRDWCQSHGPELGQGLLRAWQVPAETASCALSWRQFSEFAALPGERSALYFGRLLATELISPAVCVPGAVEHTAAELGLPAEVLAEARLEAGRVRELLHAAD
jgi:hypothetical protein